MNEVVKFLNENPVQYLATVGRDGKAKCRPFMFAGEKDGKLWFCTNNQKDVYKDMQANPNIEVSVSSPAYAWIRLNGKAVFENNMPVKEMCIQNPIVKGQYQTADNPIFEVFYRQSSQGVRPVILKIHTDLWGGVKVPTGGRVRELNSMSRCDSGTDSYSLDDRR